MDTLNNKNIYLLVILSITFLVFTFPVNAQTVNDLSNLNKEKLKKANEYYDVLEYHKAVELYLEVVQKAEEDTTILCRIANSYKMLNDHVRAEEWYKKAVVNNKTTINPQYKFYLAQELATNGKYDEALNWFKEYSLSVVNDQRALASIRSLENLSALYYDTTFYVTDSVPVNTMDAEFCPVFYKGNILFLTDRNNSKTGFLSWFISKPDSNGVLTEDVQFDNQIKMQYNAGPLAFYDNYSKVIFSQNYTPEKLKKKQINEIPLQLFSADVGDDDKWINIQLLPFVNKDYSYTQPSVSADNKTLYFSSNAPGGYGGADLYKSEMSNGIWQDPVNLGKPINTPGDEMFPFIFQDTILFFSSNGHGGLGGLDIKKINLKAQDKKIEHIGVPINSSYDDFGIIVSNDGLKGYFSSNRPGGSGSDDLYVFKVIRITLTIKIIDENTTLPVSNAEIYSADEKQIGVSDENGNYTLIIPVNQIFELKIKKDNLESEIYTINPLNTTSRKLEVNLLADKKDQINDNPTNIIFKVQIWASKKPASKRGLKKKYKGPLQINKFYEDNWYKYSIGEFSSYSEAKKCLRSSGVNDAFIISYINDKKVHISVAKAAVNKTPAK